MCLVPPRHPAPTRGSGRRGRLARGLLAVALGGALAPLSAAVPGQGASPQALAAQADEQVRIDPDASRQLAEQALARMAQGGGDADSFVLAQLVLCEHHAERSQDQAQGHAALARQRVGEVERRGLRARLLACEGEIEEGQGHTAAAFELYQQAVQAAEQASDDEYLAEALYRRGNLRSLRAEYATGMTDLKRAHELYSAVGKAGHATTVHNAIAILYNRMGDPVQARHYFEIALKAQASAGLKREQLVTVHNLGRTLENLGDWSAAEHAFTQCRGLSQELGFDRGLAYALRGLAGVSNARGQPQQALALLDDATELQRRTPDARLLAQIQLQRGLALAALARPSEAAASLRAALAVFVEAESPAERLRTHDALAGVLAAQGDWPQAWQQARQARELAEHLHRRQLDDRFATLKIEVDASAREQQIKLLQREQAATAYALEQERLAGRLRSTVVMLGAVVLAVLAWLAWRLRHGKLAMHRLAMTDELTQLPNRRDVLARLDAHLQRGEGCAAMIVDLDHFKRINDQHGYAAGDRALRAVAGVLRRAAPGHAWLGRMGGEEFLVALPHGSVEQAQDVAEAIRVATQALPASPTGLPQAITASVGVAAARDGETMAGLLHRADQALRRAKDAGRNRVCCASEGNEDVSQASRA